MLKWRIYYTDGSKFGNDKGTWEEAPALGVLCVVTLDPTGVWGRFVLHCHEYYYKVPEHEVMVSEELKLLKHHVPNIQDNQIKRGGNAWQEEWTAWLHQATSDPDFPKSSPRRRTTDWPVGDPRRPVW